MDTPFSWKTPPERAALNEKTVDIWRVPLDPPPDMLPLLVPVLSPDERVRAERFRFAGDRRRFIMARGALRTILSYYLSTPAEEIIFAYSSHGKPSLGGALAPHPLRFNVGHSHELALCAVTYGKRVGIDIEYIHPMHDIDSIAQHFFAEREVTALQALPVEQRHIGFFRCWTRKEAYIKATGEGLSRRLDQFAVSLAPDEPPQLIWVADNQEELRRWTLVDVPADATNCGALIVEGGPIEVRCWQWTAHLLSDHFTPKAAQDPA